VYHREEILASIEKEYTYTLRYIYQKVGVWR